MGRSHVGRAHLARFVYSSNFDHNAIKKLQNLDKNAICQEFHKALDFSNVRNNRSYAQVVQGKSFNNCVKSFKGQVHHSQHESSTRVMGLNPHVNSFVPSSAYSNSMSLPVTGICTLPNTYQLHLLAKIRWQSGNTLASHLCGRGSIPVMAVSGKAGSCLPLVGSLQYTTLANYMYWFPLPFQLPVVIWPVQCWKRRKTPNKQKKKKKSCKNSGSTAKASLPALGRCQSTVKNSIQTSYHTDEIALSNKFQVLQDLLLEDEAENACNSQSPSSYTAAGVSCDRTGEHNGERNGEHNGNNKVNTSTEMSLPVCTEYWQCKGQNGVEFGCVPLSPITLFSGDPTYWERIPDIITAHKLIRQSGVPNFLGLRIPVSTQLKVEAWRHHLMGYWDQQLIDLIQYGFPLDFHRNCTLGLTLDNHTSANDHASHVAKYIKEELQFGAMIGPFDKKPCTLHISPFMTWEKAQSEVRHTIIDLSWPKGQAVNDGVDKNVYLGGEFQMHYPTVDKIVKQLNAIGPSANIFKVDISRAFHHIRIDPGDIDLLGLQHQGKYLNIDLSLPFGFKLGSVSLWKSATQFVILWLKMVIIHC